MPIRAQSAGFADSAVSPQAKKRFSRAAARALPKLTVRKTTDCIIATRCIEHGVALLHLGLQGEFNRG